jgi:hypothetical protein
VDLRAGGASPFQAAHFLIEWAGRWWDTLQEDLGWQYPLEKMPARQAFVFIKGELLKNRDDDERLEIEALLGDPDALRERDSRRAAAVAEFDFEVA